MKKYLNIIARCVDTQSSFYRLVLKSPFVGIFNLVHTLIVNLELLILTRDQIIGDSTDLVDNNLTLIIKTFERPKIAQRLNR